MKPRRKEGRHREINRITLFQGENSVFVNRQTKNQKEKIGLGPTAPKHTGRLKKKTQKRARHEKKRGDFQKIPFQIRKNGVERRAPENSEKPSAPQPQADFWQRPESNPNRDTAARRKRAKNFTNWSPPGKNGKNVIFKTSSVLQLQAVFLPSKPWSKIRTSEKTNL